MERRVRPPGAAWADAVAEQWVTRLVAQPAMRMCLATGSTPLPVYDRMRRSPELFAHASVVLLDEFGDLSVDEPESCDGVLRRHLVDAVPLTDYRSIDSAASDVAAECDAIDAWIDAGPDGLLDLAVLGLGRNGHLGMNEPGSPVDGRTARVELAPSTIEGAERYFAGRARPTWGVTVGLADLLAAREVWVLATGRSKSAIVARCLDGPVTPDVPASLLQRHLTCTWWLDELAAPG